MEVVSSSDRSDLPGAVHAGHISRTQPIHEQTRIVSRSTEEPASPTIAGEDEGTLCTVVAEPGCEVPTRRSGIPDLELECGSDLHHGVDGDGS